MSVLADAGVPTQLRSLCARKKYHWGDALPNHGFPEAVEFVGLTLEPPVVPALVLALGLALAFAADRVLARTLDALLAAFRLALLVLALLLLLRLFCSLGLPLFSCDPVWS